MKKLFEIGNICRDYIVVYLFLVIWPMYSFDRMKTVIRIFKDYDKNIVLRDCQMHYLLMFIWEERRSFWFSSVIAKFFTWSTVNGLLLRHKQRLRETAKNDNSVWEIAVELTVGDIFISLYSQYVWMKCTLACSSFHD